MPTFNQITNNPRQPRFYKDKRRALTKCPQKKGTCLKVTIMTPRKPNSAQRKVSRVMLSNWKRIWGYIPGMYHNLQKHSVVLVRGGRVKDLPGMKYTLIRGKFDLQAWVTRYTARSKYGVSIERTRTMKWTWPYYARKIR